jgi:hypothetical protein
VAQFATISVDYYTRIEQGRLQASATVLGSLVRALRLDEGWIDGASHVGLHDRFVPQATAELVPFVTN